MSVSRKIEKLIWAEFAARCAVCKKHLVLESINDKVLIGEVGHIRSPRKNGPRYIEGFNADHPTNLMLLCRDHHKEVDDNVPQYPIHALEQLREDHLAWVASSFFQQTPLRLNLPFLAYINVPKLSSYAVNRGYKIPPVDLGEAGTLHSLGWSLNKVMLRFKDVLSTLVVPSIRLDSIDVPHLDYVGVIVAFSNRFRTKNIPMLSRQDTSNISFSGDQSKDPHIYSKKPGFKIVMNIDPTWITTSTAFTLFRPSSGQSQLAGIAVITNVEPEIGLITASPLVIGTPNTGFDEMMMGQQPKETFEIVPEDSEMASTGMTIPRDSELDAMADYDRALKENSFWCGEINGCDLCSRMLNLEGYFVDGKMANSGMWANMCPMCFRTKGVGEVGWGIGQLYKYQEDGSWLCIGGFQPKWMQDLSRED